LRGIFSEDFVGGALKTFQPGQGNEVTVQALPIPVATELVGGNGLPKLTLAKPAIGGRRHKRPHAPTS
jgi:hypothetical protein